MPAFNRTLSGRIAGVTSSRRVNGDTAVGSSDLNNEIVYDSASAGVITLPAARKRSALKNACVTMWKIAAT